jgi:four helix bundle protein
MKPATSNRHCEPSGDRVPEPLRVGADIAERLLAFGEGVVAVVKKLPRDVACRHLAAQLVRAGTSCGANYEEARAAESRADFIHKIGVAMKEVREAQYWLRLIDRSRLVAMPLEPLIGEAWELSAILGQSKITARENARRQ